MRASILPIIVFFISLIGYAQYIKEKFSIPYGYGICISASFIISTLWIIGLFFPITLAIYTLWGIGLFLLLYILFKKRFHFSFVLNWTNFFLAISVPFLCWYILGNRFFFIDDFNHWATMARSILENQALPGPAEELIFFVSYPPGAALWISYFLTIIDSTSEDMYLFAQAVLVLIYLCPLTVSISEKRNDGLVSTIMKGFTVVIIILLGSVCLLIGAQLLSLCVDGLLAASGIGLMCFILNYKDSLQKKIIFSIPLIVSVLSIKDYGLLYSMCAVCFLFVFVRQNGRSSRDNVTLSVVPLATVFVTEFLWQTYVSKTFTQYSSAPHSLNITRWCDVFNSRSHEDILIISKLFIQAILGKRTVLLIFGLVATLLFIYCYQHLAKDTRRKKTAEIVVFVLINYTIYLCGLAFVYLFSMEIGGAIRLESYQRYSGTEFCFLFGVCISYLLDTVFTNNPQSQSSIKFVLDSPSGTLELLRISNNLIIIMICIGLVLVLSFVYSSPVYGSYHGTSRERINMLTHEEYQGDALIYAPSQMDGYYNEYIILVSTGYDFRSIEIEIATLDDIAVFESLLTQYSHILLYDVDDAMQNYLYANGWSTECTPGLYRIDQGKIIAN